MNPLERTSRRAVEFTHAFSLGTEEPVFPPGRYEVETEEELIPGLSFIAYRRVRTTMETQPSVRGIAVQRQLLTIDPIALDAALARDRERSVRAPLSHAPQTPEDPTMTSQSQKQKASTDRTRTAGQGTPQFQKHNLISSAPVLIPVLIVASLAFITWYRPASRIVAPIDVPTPAAQSPVR